jgi:hypothetical protein
MREGMREKFRVGKGDEREQKNEGKRQDMGRIRANIHPSTS